MWVGGVRVIVFDDDDRLLMIRQHHEDRDIWMVPGGGIEEGETAVETAVREMKEEGILCSPTLSIPKDMGLPFSDAVTILGNLLDNALHASVSRQLQTGAFQSSVDLSVIWQQGTLFLHMSNPCAADTVADYGIGMKNVEEVVRKYSGTMKTEVAKGRYITDIVLFLRM